MHRPELYSFIQSIFTKHHWEPYLISPHTPAPSPTYKSSLKIARTHANTHAEVYHLIQIPLLLKKFWRQIIPTLKQMKKEHKGHHFLWPCKWPTSSAIPSQNDLMSLCRYNHSGTTSSVKDHLPLWQQASLHTADRVMTLVLKIRCPLSRSRLREPTGVPRFL